MPKIRTKKEARKIVKKYSQELTNTNFPYKAVYLFGSHASGKAGKWSDIDVAVVSDAFKRNWEKSEILMWRIRRKVDSMIEPIGFTPEDFRENADPMVYEIKKTGIRIA